MLLCPRPAEALAKRRSELVSLLLRGPVPTVPCRADVQTDVGFQAALVSVASEASQSLFCSKAAVRKNNSLLSEFLLSEETGARVLWGQCLCVACSH